MSERMVRPIRAWAEYDEWSVFLQEFDAEYWDVVFTPRAEDDWEYSREEFVGIVDFMRGSTDEAMKMQVGPLRSLRVLYENGYELKLEPSGLASGHLHEWFWYLHQFKDDPEIPHGRFTEDKDSEAVERAMIAAAAFFSQRQDVIISAAK